MSRKNQECEGCRLGLENQIAHLSGCLKQFYTITVSDCEIQTVDEEGATEIFYIVRNTRYGVFTELFRIIEKVLETVQPHDVRIVVDDKNIFDILSGKCYGKVSYYTFYLKFKSFGVTLSEQI